MANAPPTRYVTLNGQPPNGGIPFDRRFYVEETSQPSNLPSPGPTGFSSVGADVRPTGADAGANPDLPPTPPLDADYASIATTHLNNDSSTNALAPFVPPSRRLEGPTSQGGTADPITLTHNGYTYLVPSRFINIQFLNEGDRPWGQADMRRLPVKNFRVPRSMKVYELIRELLAESHGTTRRRANAIREILPRGDRFEGVLVFEEQGPYSHRTLDELGWDQRHGYNDPVILALVF